MKKFSLCGEWKLAVMPHETSVECSCSQELHDLNVEIIPATVPGNLELDLNKAGKVGDLFFGTNPDKIRRYTEKLHCYYFKSFTFEEFENDPVLCFEGLDCYADVYLNGIKVASYDNMLIEHKCEISSFLKKGENEIFVHIKPAVKEALKYDYSFLISAGPSAYEQLYVRKPAHMFGWDIMPRYLSAGIWKPVYIELHEKEEIDEFFLSTTLLGKDTATLELQYSAKCDIFGDIKFKLFGKCEDSIIEAEIPLVFPKGRKKIIVKNPKLWWPKGFGAPNLYECVLTLVRDGKIIDEVKFNHGIRTVRLDCTDIIDDDGNGEFVFVVNNKKVFIKGSNWLPTDPFHSRDKGRIPSMIKLAEEANCNMLRCWGGNVYEDDLFYELCDKAGIMVWQDFCFACGKYPQDDEFVKRIRIEAVQVVKRLRSHPCIALWSGDNECDIRWVLSESIKVDPNKNIISRKILPDVVEQYDTASSYLPSSPYINPTIASMVLKDKRGFESEALLSAPEWHAYLWYGYFKNAFPSISKLKFMSEFGAMGFPSPESLKKYISPEKLWPYDDDNDEWRMHVTTAIPELSENNFRIKIFFEQLMTIFNKEPDSLSDFAIKSQITQGEQLKYYMEQFRAQKWNKTGILWWNLIDGWPQFSDAVVDYYYDRKKAFYDLKSCQQDVCLIVTDSKDGKFHDLTVANDTLKDIKINYSVKDADSGEILASGSSHVLENTSTVVSKIPVSSSTRFLLIEWDGDVSGKNHYLDIQENKEKISKEQYIGWLKKCGLCTEWVNKISLW